MYETLFHIVNQNDSVHYKCMYHIVCNMNLQEWEPNITPQNFMLRFQVFPGGAMNWSQWCTHILYCSCWVSIYACFIQVGVTVIHEYSWKVWPGNTVCPWHVYHTRVDVPYLIVFDAYILHIHEWSGLNNVKFLIWQFFSVPWLSHLLQCGRNVVGYYCYILFSVSSAFFTSVCVQYNSAVQYNKI